MGDNTVLIRVLLADDHAIVRQCLRSLIQEHPNVDVVGEAEDGRRAVNLARELQPDVVIMDLCMPNLNGIEATRQILSELPQIKVVGLSGYSDILHVDGMLSAGASGYVLKEFGFSELIKAIMTVCSGKIYLCSKVNQMVVSEYIRESPGKTCHLLGALSAREREVLQLLAEGRTTKQIALHLHVSPKTIEANRRTIMEKLDVYNVPGLVKLAIRGGLTPLEQ